MQLEDSGHGLRLRSQHHRALDLLQKACEYYIYPSMHACVCNCRFHYGVYSCNAKERLGDTLQLYRQIRARVISQSRLDCVREPPPPRSDMESRHAGVTPVTTLQLSVLTVLRWRGRDSVKSKLDAARLTSPVGCCT